MGTQIRQNGDGSLGLVNDSDSVEVSRFGGQATPDKNVATYRDVKVAKVAITAASGNGGALAWQNPEGASIAIVNFGVSVTTVATGACTIDFGTTATSAATSSNTLITALDVNGATGYFDNITDKGASGKSRQPLASGKWVTGTVASGTVTGLVGNAYISYVVL